MQQTFATNASAAGAHLRENEILFDVERVLNEPTVAPPQSTATTPPRLRLIVPLVLLAGVGAVLALMPAGVKDVLITGRSVAHSLAR